MIKIIMGMLGNMFRHPIGRRQKSKTLMRFIRWQVGSRILGESVAMPFVKNTRLLVCTGMHGATMNLYVGLQEFDDMAFLLHLVRPGDTCIDVGANVGVYTLLAAGVRQAQVIAIEPVPDTYEQFLDNINLNRLGSNVVSHNVGVAAEEGELRFSVSLGPTNHVLRPGEGGAAVTVPVKMLDAVAADSSPVLVKVDVEGFEQEVIRGGTNVFSNPSLLAIVIELNGLGTQYGFDDHTIDLMLREFGFVPAHYSPFERELTVIGVPNSTGNTLYIRPSAELDDRLRSSEPIEIYGISF